MRQQARHCNLQPTGIILILATGPAPAALRLTLEQLPLFFLLCLFQGLPLPLFDALTVRRLNTAQHSMGCGSCMGHQVGRARGIRSCLFCMVLRVGFEWLTGWVAGRKQMLYVSWSAVLG